MFVVVIRCLFNISLKSYPVLRREKTDDRPGLGFSDIPVHAQELLWAGSAWHEMNIQATHKDLFVSKLHSFAFRRQSRLNN